MQSQSNAGSGRLLARVLRNTSSATRRSVAALGLLLTLVAGLADYASGPDLAPLTFYLVPVALVGWAGPRWLGILTAVVSGVLWAVSEAARGREYASGWLFFWSSATRLVVFLVIVSLLHHSRTLVQGAGPGMPGRRCQHCGSNDTTLLRVGLVCLECKRLSEEADAPSALRP